MQVQINVLKQRGREVVFENEDDCQQCRSTGEKLQTLDSHFVRMKVEINQLILQ
jgi:hypothetical protein